MVVCGRLSWIWCDCCFFFGGGFVEDMEYYWLFVVCVIFVLVFVIGVVVLLWRYEGVKVLILWLDKVEDFYLVVCVLIGYLCWEEFWNVCGGVVNLNYLFFFWGFCLIYFLLFFGYNIFWRNFVVLFFYMEWMFILFVVYFVFVFW